MLKRKGGDKTQSGLEVGPGRLAQGLVADADVKVVQLKIHKETGLNCPELLPC